MTVSVRQPLEDIFAPIPLNCHDCVNFHIFSNKSYRLSDDNSILIILSDNPIVNKKRPKFRHPAKNLSKNLQKNRLPFRITTTDCVLSTGTPLLPRKNPPRQQKRSPPFGEPLSPIGFILFHPIFSYYSPQRL